MANFSSIPDFFNNDSFIRWVLFGEYEDYWHEFQVTNPDKIELLTQARELILKIQESENIPVPLNERETWSKIQQTINADSPTVRRPALYKAPELFSRAFWIAATVILGISAFLFWRYQPAGSDTYAKNIDHIGKGVKLIEKVNHSPNPLKVILEDGSLVILKQFGKISYPLIPDPLKREVYLHGEAFFSVKKNPKRPFYVYANEVVTKVLGTSFTIRAFEEDPRVIVKVQTGSVSVFSQKSPDDAANRELNGLIILPNQEIEYNRSAVRFNKRLVEKPLPLQDIPPNLLTDYEEVDVTQLLLILEKVYGVNIIFNEEALSSCIITTNLNQQSLFDAMEIICKTIGASYKVIDTQIILESEGCH